MPVAQRHQVEYDDDDDEGVSQHPRSGDRSNSDLDDESDEEMDPHAEASRSADEQMAKKLIRYAISCEYSRTLIRRDGIRERVLGKHGRSFRRIFALAQKQLREVWGMELRELPVREKMTLHEKRQAMKSNSQPKTGSGAYILSSTLPEAYRSASIITPSRAPSAEDEATYVAFYTMVVSLIMLNGGELAEQKLSRYLERMNADQNVSSEKTEVTMKKMERHGYVIRRVDKPPVGQDGEHTVIWHVGPRAKEEIGLDGVMGLVREVYGHPEDEDFEKKLRSSLGIKSRPDTIQEADAQGEDVEMANGS